jgi:hypothetical protein
VMQLGIVDYKERVRHRATSLNADQRAGWTPGWQNTDRDEQVG